MDNTQYPEIQSLLRSYLNQDYEYISEDLDEVLRTYKRHTPPDRLGRLIDEVHALLSANSQVDDATFTDTFDRLFHPEIDFDDWDGRTTRSTLRHMLELLTEA